MAIMDSDQTMLTTVVFSLQRAVPANILGSGFPMLSRQGFTSIFSNSMSMAAIAVNLQKKI